MKKLSVLLFILFSNSLMATTETGLDQSVQTSYLPNEMWLKVFSHMNLKSLLNSAQVSTSFKTLSYRTFEDPQFIDQLSDEEIILIGFKKPDHLMEITKKKLETLPGLDTKSEKIIAVLILDQVRSQVRTQVGSQVGVIVLDQIEAQDGDQVMNKISDQVVNKIGAQVVNKIGAQVVHQIGTQVWYQAQNQVRAHVEAQIGDILTLYPNVESSEDDRKSFKKAFIILINRCVCIYHYLFVKRMLEPSEDVTKIHRDGSRMTIFEAMVAQIKDEIAEGDINLSAIYNAATPDGWEEFNPNIKNFLYPIQKYSQPSAN